MLQCAMFALHCRQTQLRGTKGPQMQQNALQWLLVQGGCCAAGTAGDNSASPSFDCVAVPSSRTLQGGSALCCAAPVAYPCCGQAATHTVCRGITAVQRIRRAQIRPQTADRVAVSEHSGATRRQCAAAAAGSCEGGKRHDAQQASAGKTADHQYAWRVSPLCLFKGSKVVEQQFSRARSRGPRHGRSSCNVQRCDVQETKA